VTSTHAVINARYWNRSILRYFTTETMAGPKQTLTLQDAAERLGVHYMTAYRYVRLGQLKATQRDGRWYVRASDVDALRDAGRRRRTGTRTARRGTPAWKNYRNRLRGRLLDGDGSGAWSVVEQALVSGAAPTDVYVDIIGPVMRDIGAKWQQGGVSIAEEHRASTAARRVVNRVSPRFTRRGRNRGTVILGGASGDSHELPVAMVADVLRSASFDVVELGADTPIESFVQMAKRVDPVAIGISASTQESVAVVGKTVRALRRARPNTPILVGGPAFTSQDDATAVGADGWAADARGVVDAITAAAAALDR
jgi:MerR family transcriptional regulator, light-induced transcriptional regulator